MVTQVDNRIYYDEKLFSTPGYHWILSPTKKSSWLILVKNIKESFFYIPTAYIVIKDENWYEVHHYINIGGKLKEGSDVNNSLGIVYYINRIDFDFQEVKDKVLEVEEFCMNNSLRNSLKELINYNFQLDDYEFPNLEIIYGSSNTILSNTIIRSMTSDKIYTGTSDDGFRTYILVNTSGSIPTGDIGRSLEPIGYVDLSNQDSIVILNIMITDDFYLTIKGSASCMSTEDIVRLYLSIRECPSPSNRLNIICSNEFEILQGILDISVGWKY